MPVVDVDPDELRELTGHAGKDDDELRADLFDLGLEFEGWTDEEEMQLEFAPDRLDRLSVEGIARSLRYHYGDDRGVYVPSTNDAEWTIEVDSSVPDGRPYVTGAVVRGLDLDQRLERAVVHVQPADHRTRHVGPALGDRGVDLDGPLGVVRLRNVHPPVVAVVVPQRPGDALHREPIEAVGRELELHLVVLGPALELDAEVEQVRAEVVVAFLVVAGQLP